MEAKHKLRVSLIVLLVLALVVYAGFRQFIAGGSVPRPGREYVLLIPTNADFESVVALLNAQGVLRSEAAFRRLAALLKYERAPMRAGRFIVKGGWTTLQLVRHLRGGPQAPVNVVLNNERLTEDVAGKVARFIEPDSLEMLQLLSDKNYLAGIGFSPDDLMSLFIPNTYQFFWNTTPEKFVARMVQEHDKFWKNERRLEKAQALGLSPKQVYTLASIVEKETLRRREKPRIAGAYLNRLRIGMPLQADPTAVFATRDFTTKRVTEYHTKFDSPFNTYKYPGLPPGPIAMASIASIDAVLNPEKHNYIYFCAIGDESGLHAFAETYDQHLNNVERFRQNLRRRGLR
jgi:UPF0755 protein